RAPGRRLARGCAAAALATRRTRRALGDVRRSRAGLGAGRAHRADAPRIRDRVAAAAHRMARGARRHPVDASHPPAGALPLAGGAPHHPRTGGGPAHEGVQMMKRLLLFMLAAGCATQQNLRKAEEDGEKMRFDLAETYVRKGAYTAAIPLLRREVAAR